MRKVLFATENKAKVKRFEKGLLENDIEIITINDLKEKLNVEENGKNAIENALIKARAYSKVIDIPVFAMDDNLYIEGIPEEKQPGMFVRRVNGKRLNDEEMIEYYSNLIGELGGKVSAYYLDGIAVYNNGRISSFMDRESAKNVGAFYMIDKASTKRFEGWPLDSLSISKETGRYFVESSDSESKENIIYGEYEKRIVGFLKEALGIK